MLDVSSEGVDTATKSIGVNGITAAASADPNYRHFLKPRFRVGDQVYAAWWPSDTSPASWYAGTVKSFCDVECNGNENSITYGPLRFYDVAFDDGDEQDDILDAFVFDRSDYLLTLRHQTWLGVKNVVDENSEDDWARVVGWYNAVIEGEERSFSLLLDALRAHDAYTVRQNGPTTKQSQLNLPEEWKFFFAHERRPPENKILCTRTSCDDSSKVAFELATYRLPSFESTGVDELLKQNDKTLSSPYRTQALEKQISDYDGIYFDKRRGFYEARIRHSGRRAFLGYYNLAADAAFAYDEAARCTKESGETLNFATQEDYENARVLEIATLGRDQVDSLAVIASKIEKSLSRVFAVNRTALCDDSSIETIQSANEYAAEECDLVTAKSTSVATSGRDKKVSAARFSCSTRAEEKRPPQSSKILLDLKSPYEHHASQRKTSDTVKRPDFGGCTKDTEQSQCVTTHAPIVSYPPSKDRNTQKKPSHYSHITSRESTLLSKNNSSHFETTNINKQLINTERNQIAYKPRPGLPPFPSIDQHLGKRKNVCNMLETTANVIEKKQSVCAVKQTSRNVPKENDTIKANEIETNCLSPIPTTENEIHSNHLEPLVGDTYRNEPHSNDAERSQHLAKGTKTRELPFEQKVMKDLKSMEKVDCRFISVDSSDVFTYERGINRDARNDDFDITHMPFHVFSSNSTSSNTRKAASSKFTATDEAPHSKGKQQMIKFTDAQAKQFRFPIGCRVWCSAKLMDCDQYGNVNDLERGWTDENIANKIRIKNRLRKMEEMLIEKWDLKEDPITAYGEHYLSNEGEIVNGDNMASSSANRGQSFHVGEVRSIYMDCISKEIIYEVMIVENHRNAKRKNADPIPENFTLMIPEEELVYGAKCNPHG